MPILDPGIHVSRGYAPYDEGIAQDVFIKDVTGQPYVGQVSICRTGLGRGMCPLQLCLSVRLPCKHVSTEEGSARCLFAEPSACTLQLWPGAVHWADFMAPRAVAWWTSQLTALHNELPLDGVWLDMNEPSNFCTGDVCTATGASLCTVLQHACTHAGHTVQQT